VSARNTSSSVGRSTLTIAVRPGTTTPQIVHALDDASLEVVDVSVERPTLDDVFLALTGHRAEEES
jgi:hypothetical protein